MRIPPVFFAFLFCFSVLSVFRAQGQQPAGPRHLDQLPGYREAISPNRVLLVYAADVSDERLLALLKPCKSLYAYQPAKPLVPGRFLAHIKPGSRWQDVAEELKPFSEITAVTPWLRDAAGHERGILPQVYVKLKSDDALPQLRETTRLYGGEWKGERADMPGIWELSFDKNAPYNAREMAIYLNGLPFVEFADPNTAFFLAVNSVNDSLYSRQWALENVGGAAQWNGTPGADMEVSLAWTVTTGDPTIRIAIMDSGIDTLHPDLRPNLLPGFDATGHGSHGYPNANFPSDGHGTACAGIAAAKGNNGIGVAGVAYDCKIMPVKMFVYIDTTLFIPGFVDTTLYEMPYSETDYMVGGINWAWQTGGADVMSNSWGIPADLLQIAPIDQLLVNQAIQNASHQGRGGKGAIQLFSSGNDNASAPIWPSYMTTVIAVGATTNKDKRASFSNYGTGLEVCAPGVQVTTTDMLDTNGFSPTEYMLDFGGTSAACPNAAGVAALALSVRPDLTFSQMKSLLRVSAEKVGGYVYNDTPAGSWSTQLGYGRVNAYRAVTYAPALSVSEQPDASFSLALYPNPALSSVSVLTEGLGEGWFTYTIVDISGKAVLSGRFFASEGSVAAVPVESLSAGLYAFRLQAGDRLLSVKFVKN